MMVGLCPQAVMSLAFASNTVLPVTMLNPVERVINEVIEQRTAELGEPGISTLKLWTNFDGRRYRHRTLSDYRFRVFSRQIMWMPRGGQSAFTSP